MNIPCGKPEQHSGHTHPGDSDMEWCDGNPQSDDTSLLDDLEKALVANGTKAVCAACDALAAVSESVRGPLADALAGTIGRDKLVTILHAHGYNVSRRTIERHRREAHTP